MRRGVRVSGRHEEARRESVSRVQEGQAGATRESGPTAHPPRMPRRPCPCPPGPGRPQPPTPPASAARSPPPPMPQPRPRSRRRPRIRRRPTEGARRRRGRGGWRYHVSGGVREGERRGRGAGGPRRAPGRRGGEAGSEPARIRVRRRRSRQRERRRGKEKRGERPPPGHLNSIPGHVTPSGADARARRTRGGGRDWRRRRWATPRPGDKIGAFPTGRKRKAQRTRGRAGSTWQLRGSLGGFFLSGGRRRWQLQDAARAGG